VNSFSNSQRIGIDICSGCIRSEKGMDFGVENEDIALKNTYFWDLKSE
jgi:hypothetical protein